ncbi:cytochrome P450 [Ahniella affigens]|uniref:Cytochrome P450 n=1 Tax=Ahniella affigens TaxID=2021234 RepID=A0A2P1PQN1_9GAMM|nr:cytochrome P450 [Ahniella affigens]AVP97150.1 cytochrome P450 [Ahniella affigens]
MQTASARTTESMVFDPLSKRFKDNPYPVLRLLREHDPIHRSGYGLLIATRYDDVLQIIKDKRFKRDFDAGTISMYGEAGLQDYSTQVIRHWIVNHNPPEHTRLRKHMVRAISSARMLRMEQPIRRFCDVLIDRVAQSQQIDLVADYTFPLTALVICEMLGIPEGERSMFVENSIVPDPGLLDIVPVNPATMASATKKIRVIIQYFEELCERKRKAPTDDFTSDLVRFQADDPELTLDCITAHMFFMFFAGHQSTQNLISNALYALYSHPDQLQVLRANPALIDNAVEELIRFDTSVQTAHVHYAMEDVLVGETMIRQGELVLPLFGAANRDPVRYQNPEILDLQRPAPTHLTFGGGAHYCIGARLATMELKGAIEALERRLPTLRLRRTPPNWLSTYTLRGLKTLPAEW